MSIKRADRGNAEDAEDAEECQRQKKMREGNWEKVDVPKKVPPNGCDADGGSIAKVRRTKCLFKGRKDGDVWGWLAKQRATGEGSTQGAGTSLRASCQWVAATNVQLRAGLCAVLPLFSQSGPCGRPVVPPPPHTARPGLVPVKMTVRTNVRP